MKRLILTFVGRRALIFKITVVSLSADVLAAKMLLEQCEKVVGAKGNLIYLHGLDTPSPGSLEIENRKNLQTFATKIKMNFVRPRSQEVCDKKLCWRHKNSDEVAKTFDSLKQAIASCVDSKLPLIYIGFSNGGYLTSKIALTCPPGMTTFISSGIAGNFDGNKNLKVHKPCPKIIQFIGKGDLTYKKSKAFHEELLKHGFVSEFYEHPFKHVVSIKELSQLPVWENLDAKKK